MAAQGAERRRRLSKRWRQWLDAPGVSRDHEERRTGLFYGGDTRSPGHDETLTYACALDARRRQSHAQRRIQRKEEEEEEQQQKEGGRKASTVPENVQ